MKIKLIMILCILLLALSVSARHIILTWDPNSEPDISHYIVYWGTESGNYTSNSGNTGLGTRYERDIPDDGQTYYFAVTAVNEAGLESDFSNEVNTGDAPTNTAPVANAGADQYVNSGSLVTLDGSGSYDTDGDVLSYIWSQTGGEEVVLSSNEVVSPTFTAPAVISQNVILSFRLTVKDPAGLQSTDNCLVTVSNPHAGPPSSPSGIRVK